MKKIQGPKEPLCHSEPSPSEVVYEGRLGEESKKTTIIAVVCILVVMLFSTIVIYQYAQQGSSGNGVLT